MFKNIIVIIYIIAIIIFLKLESEKRYGDREHLIIELMVFFILFKKFNLLNKSVFILSVKVIAIEN
jgi:hypothetical protein